MALTRRARFNSLLLAVAAGAIWGQTITASLEGFVYDASGALIPGARVQVVHTGTNAAVALQSNANGRFVAPSLPAGPYALTVEADGFKRFERGGIVLQVGQAARIEIRMEIGNAGETVSVSGEAPLLETGSSAVGQVVDNRSIVNLPLNQRNPYALVFLTPGVIGNVGSNYNDVNISFNGGRPGSNEILVDGIPSSPPLNNPIQGFTVFPSVDAVQEFKVQTNTYSAEFGRSGGGIINLIYKSGTNQFHGSVFEFLRNSRLDANNFFANSRGIPLRSFKRNQFGLSAGGPVLIPRVHNGRNRTFFFFAYEELRQRSSDTLVATVPTPAQRNGDFSTLRNQTGAAVTIFDPVTTTSTGSGFIRQPFPGNIIPAARIDPVARAAMPYFPLASGAGDPNSAANNYAAPGTLSTDSRQWDVKLDKVINDRNRFFLRISHKGLKTGDSEHFPAELLVAENGTRQPDTFNNAGFDYTATLSPAFLLNIRYGFGRALAKYRPFGFGFDPTKLGLPSYIRESAEELAFPGFVPANYLSIGNGGGAFRNDAFETHSLSVANTRVLTRHVLRFGGETRLNRVNNRQSRIGDFRFDRSFTQGPDPNRATAVAGDSIASMLIGLGTGSFTRNLRDVATTSPYHAFFLADDYKVSKKLTLNLGVRYELDIPRKERYDRINVFNPHVPSPLAGQVGLPSLRGGLEFADGDQAGRRQFPTDRNNWAPRVGFAYQALKNTVLRGGYGIFYVPSLRAAGGNVGTIGFRSDTPWVASLDGVTPRAYLRNPYPEGIQPTSGRNQGLLTGLGAPIVATEISDYVVPYTQNWSYNVQQQLPGSLLIEAGYIGNRGLHLSEADSGSDYNLNQLRPEQLTLGAQLQQNVPNPFFGLIQNSPLNARLIPQSFLLTAHPQFTTIHNLFKSGASSTYHSFQLKVEKRFSSGLSLLLSYTGAKLIDNYSRTHSVGRTASQQNIYDRRSERAVSPNDVAQRMVFSYVYALPFGRGLQFGGTMSRWRDALLGGWQVNGIVSAQSGQPLNLTTQNTSRAGNALLRPNNNGRSARLTGPVQPRLSRYFDTTAFSQPAPFTFGNTGRTLPDVRGPGLRSWDFSLFKNFHVVEGVSVQFRAEAFNLSNTPAFGFPNMVASAPQFGVINSQANDPRQVQFGLKLLF